MGEGVARVYGAALQHAPLHVCDRPGSLSLRERMIGKRRLFGLAAGGGFIQWPSERRSKQLDREAI